MRAVYFYLGSNGLAMQRISQSLTGNHALS